LTEKKVLVVDDQIFLQRIIEVQVKKYGYTYIQALSGKDALQKVIEQKPDLITLDLMMPDIHGFEVLKKIKDEPATANIPVIILSGSNNPDIKTTAMQLGAITYLTKPFIGNILIAEIDFFLKEKEIPQYEENNLIIFCNAVLAKKTAITSEMLDLLFRKWSNTSAQDVMIKLCMILVDKNYSSLKKFIYLLTSHGSKPIREKAIWTLGNIGEKFIEKKQSSDAGLLFSILEKNSENIETRILAGLSLKKLGYSSAVDSVIEELNRIYTESF